MSRQLSTVTDPASGTKNKYVTMRLDNQLFGMSVETVRDVLMPQAITPVPLAPAEILGLINLRGRIVTVISLRKKLNLHTKDGEYTHRHVVVDYYGETYSLIVDSVSDVLEIQSSDIVMSPENLSKEWKEICSGVFPMKEELMVVVDVDKIIYQEVKEAS